MAYTTAEFLKLRLPPPNIQEKEKAEDEYYDNLAELMERCLVPWTPAPKL